MNPPKYDKTEDMANLTFLNEASGSFDLWTLVYDLWSLIPLVSSLISARCSAGQSQGALLSDDDLRELIGVWSLIFDILNCCLISDLWRPTRVSSASSSTRTSVCPSTPSPWSSTTWASGELLQFDLWSLISVNWSLSLSRNEMPPHLFATSDEAYRNMVQVR